MDKIIWYIRTFVGILMGLFSFLFFLAWIATMIINDPIITTTQFAINLLVSCYITKSILPGPFKED